MSLISWTPPLLVITLVYHVVKHVDKICQIYMAHDVDWLC